MCIKKGTVAATCIYMYIIVGVHAYNSLPKAYQIIGAWPNLPPLPLPYIHSLRLCVVLHSIHLVWYSI